MKKLVILMALVLAMSTAVLANPIFEDRGAEFRNLFELTEKFLTVPELVLRP